MAQNVIRVPQGCSTMNKAMDLAVIFSERKEYTKAGPLKIKVEKGVHKTVGFQGRMFVTCSHITFVGKGKNQTTIQGGFWVNAQQNVKFEELTLTNPYGVGLCLSGSETTVDVLKCIIKECEDTGMDVRGGAIVTATQCEFVANANYGVFCSEANSKVRLNDSTSHHNKWDGLVVTDAIVDLHGTKTDIHSHKGNGIYASGCAKVNIHLPSQHNTTHDNRKNRVQCGDASIANINTDGTFTHVAAAAAEE